MKLTNTSRRDVAVVTRKVKRPKQGSCSSFGVEASSVSKRRQTCLHEHRAVGVHARDLSIADDHGRVAQTCSTRPNISLASLRPCFPVINCLIGAGEGWIEILSGSHLQAENAAVRVVHREDAIGRTKNLIGGAVAL